MQHKHSPTLPSAAEDTATRVGYAPAAKFIGVRVGTLRAWVSKKTVPHYRLGTRHVVFDLRELGSWLQNKHVGAATTEGGA